MNFISYSNIFLPNISDQNNVIITAEKQTSIEKINVCNLSNDNSGIRIFLKQIQSLNVPIPVETFVIRNLLLEKNITKNLIDFIGSSIFLNDGDSLVIYSGGYSQLFDCVVDFYEFNEVINNNGC